MQYHDKIQYITCMCNWSFANKIICCQEPEIISFFVRPNIGDFANLFVLEVVHTFFWTSCYPLLQRQLMHVIGLIFHYLKF